MLFRSVGYILLLLVHVQSFADWMLRDFCDRHLELDEIIMNNKVVKSNDRLIIVTRMKESGPIILKDNDSYEPGETLEISLSEGERKIQHVFEVTSGNAKFSKGGCNGIRSTKPKSILTIDKDTTDPVIITAGTN